MANAITLCRIFCSAVLLFFPAFSRVFYILYCFAGFTDMLDGAIARRTNTVSEFGSVLDTVADIVFVSACLIKMLPSLRIPVWLLIWIGIIAAIKVINIVCGYVVQKKFVTEHTILNKVTGAVLFIFPLILSVVDVKYSGSAVCVISTIAAVHEGYIISVKNRKFLSR